MARKSNTAALRLHQLLAIEKDVSSKGESELTRAYHSIQKPDLFKGFSKAYVPVDENGQKLPPEAKQVQARVPELIDGVRKAVGKQLDVWFQRDTTNCNARADVVVDGVPVIKQAPVTFLLALEKRLTNLRTFVSKLPTLDTADVWAEDTGDAGLFRTPEAIPTQRTEKVVEPMVIFEPSEHCKGGKHEMVSTDKLVGHWYTTKLSGAIQPQVQRQYLDRIDKLIESVKVAREEANAVEVVDPQEAGDAIFKYLFS